MDRDAQMEAVGDLGVTAGRWELEYDGSLAIGGQISVNPANIGPDNVTLDERKANVRLFAVSRELYGHTARLADLLASVLDHGVRNRADLQAAIKEARLQLVSTRSPDSSRIEISSLVKELVKLTKRIQELESDPKVSNAHVLFNALERVTNQLSRSHPEDQDEAWVQARVALARAAGGVA